MTLVDVLMQYSTLPPWQRSFRRNALLEMTPTQLETEAKEFCGGRPWAEWQQMEATRAAFDALRTP